MPLAFFCTDLHGRLGRYRALLQRVEEEKPSAVLIGGDLLPHPLDPEAPRSEEGGFLTTWLRPQWAGLRDRMGEDTPRLFLILGNDDPRTVEAELHRGEEDGLWEYVHERCVDWEGWRVCGYNFVPPTPFQLKDWERYDVSRYVDPGCVPPDQGIRTDGAEPREIRWRTIRDDLDRLSGDRDQSRTVWLFHTPPYQTNLDRAGIEGKMVDHAPVDPNVGSIAVREFLERRQPPVSLHGHIHESAHLTGSWRDRLGRTHLLGGAHGGPELSLIRFDPEHLDEARRELVPPVTEAPTA